MAFENNFDGTMTCMECGKIIDGKDMLEHKCITVENFIPESY